MEKKKKYFDIKKERERDKRLVDSFNYAIEGLITTLRNEKHMKVHIFATILILIFAIITNSSKTEILIISLSISLVIVMEMINTAVEAIVDFVSPQRHELAKIAKDVAAGAVLVAAINALCVGYLIFYDKLLDLFSEDKIHIIAGRKANVSILIIILTSILVIIIKSFYKRGTPLEGGMPSGHSAIAFAIFGNILFLVSDIRVIALVFMMALLVAQSRVKAGIHSIREVIAGGILGFSVSFIILLVMIEFGLLYN